VLTESVDRRYTGAQRLTILLSRAIARLRPVAVPRKGPCEGIASMGDKSPKNKDKKQKSAKKAKAKAAAAKK
jgi:hypothetical protein